MTRLQHTGIGAAQFTDNFVTRKMRIDAYSWHRSINLTSIKGTLIFKIHMVNYDFKGLLNHTDPKNQRSIVESDVIVLVSESKGGAN
ncbi:hypothetical protein GCM10028810_04050 [Spirosoma litoris]